jgi:TPR repeat protein
MVPRCSNAETSARSVQSDSDISNALRLFRCAAHSNHPEAQFHLDDILENGRGVARDRQEAMHRFSIASQQGFSKATAALKRMQMQ